ncbi:MAG: DUF448 domain-containing protein [Candidatus Improbicoccus devescovinae]|nr:MAG: DUF448 domain-containing protein [Candidatus Improbicoccus devescovinae]
MNLTQKCIRKCVACGTQDVKNKLIRINRSPKIQKNVLYVNVLAPQANLRYLEGRSAYICPKKKCLKKIIKSKRLEKVLECKIDDAFYQEMQNIIEINKYD